MAKLVNLVGTSDSTVKNHEPEELIHREELEGTPFHIVKVEQSYFVALGKYRLSDFFESALEAKSFILNFNWNTLMNVLVCVIETLNSQDYINSKIKK